MQSTTRESTTLVKDDGNEINIVFTRSQTELHSQSFNALFGSDEAKIRKKERVSEVYTPKVRLEASAFEDRQVQHAHSWTAPLSDPPKLEPKPKSWTEPYSQPIVTKPDTPKPFKKVVVDLEAPERSLNAEARRLAKKAAKVLSAERKQRPMTINIETIEADAILYHEQPYCPLKWKVPVILPETPVKNHSIYIEEQEKPQKTTQKFRLEERPQTTPLKMQVFPAFDTLQPTETRPKTTTYHVLKKASAPVPMQVCTDVKMDVKESLDCLRYLPHIEPKQTKKKQIPEHRQQEPVTPLIMQEHKVYTNNRDPLPNHLDSTIKQPIEDISLPELNREQKLSVQTQQLDLRLPQPKIPHVIANIISQEVKRKPSTAAPSEIASITLQLPECHQPKKTIEVERLRKWQVYKHAPKIERRPRTEGSLSYDFDEKSYGALTVKTVKSFRKTKKTQDVVTLVIVKPDPVDVVKPVKQYKSKRPTSAEQPKETRQEMDFIADLFDTAPSGWNYSVS